MKKLLFVCLLTGAAVFLLLAQTPRVAPGRVAGGSSQAPVYAPYEMLSVYPQESGNGEFVEVDPAHLRSLSGGMAACVRGSLRISERGSCGFKPGDAASAAAGHAGLSGVFFPA